MMVWTVMIEGKKGCWASEIAGTMDSGTTLLMADEKFGHHGRIIGVIRGAHSTCFFPKDPMRREGLNNDQLPIPFNEGGHKTPPTS
jgi:hypothetical protein